MIRRIRDTFEELNPSRQWKFESSYLKQIVKISTESIFSCFQQIAISDMIFLRCETWRYTKTRSKDQLDHERR